MMRVLLVLLAALAYVGYAATGEHNTKQTGRSYYYKEVDLDSVVKFVQNAENDVILSIYGDTCSHCQEIHPQQEKGAKKVLEETSDVTFARIDTFRFGGPKVIAMHLQKHLPDWVNIEQMSTEYLAAPQMWIFRKQKKVEQVPHGVIGWGDDGWKNLRKWVRESVNNGNGYDWQTAKKAVKAKARAEKKAAKAAAKEPGKDKKEKKTDEKKDTKERTEEKKPDADAKKDADKKPQEKKGEL